MIQMQSEGIAIIAALAFLFAVPSFVFTLVTIIREIRGRK